MLSGSDAALPPALRIGPSMAPTPKQRPRHPNHQVTALAGSNRRSIDDVLVELEVGEEICPSTGLQHHPTMFDGVVTNSLNFRSQGTPPLFRTILSGR